MGGSGQPAPRRTEAPGTKKRLKRDATLPLLPLFQLEPRRPTAQERPRTTHSAERRRSEGQTGTPRSRSCCSHRWTRGPEAWRPEAARPAERQHSRGRGETTRYRRRRPSSSGERLEGEDLPYPHHPRNREKELWALRPKGPRRLASRSAGAPEAKEGLPDPTDAPTAAAAAPPPIQERGKREKTLPIPIAPKTGKKRDPWEGRSASPPTAIVAIAVARGGGE